MIIGGRDDDNEIEGKYIAEVNEEEEDKDKRRRRWRKRRQEAFPVTPNHRGGCRPTLK